MGNPYLPSKAMNPQAEYRRGSLGALVQNMNLRSPHAGDTNLAGVNRRDYSERYNAGALPWQIEMQKLEQDRLDGESLRTYREKSVQSNDLNDYAKLFAEGKVPKGEDGATIPYNKWVTTMATTTRGRPRSVEEMEYLITSQEQLRGEKFTDEERGQFIAQTWFPNQRGGAQFDINGAPVYGQQVVGEGMVSQPAINTIQEPGGMPQQPPAAPQASPQLAPPHGQPQASPQPTPPQAQPQPAPAMDPATGAIPNPKRSLEQAVLGEQKAVAKRESGVTEAKAIMKMDTDFRSTAINNVPKLRQSLGDARALLQAIQNGQFQATGPFEGIYAKYTNKETAQLNAMSIRKVLENLQITNLAPVTENEIKMISQMFASVGQDPEANQGILEDAIMSMETILVELQRKNTYWQENDGSLKDYNMNIPGGDWTAPLPSLLGIDRNPGSTGKIKTAKEYLDGVD